MFKKMLLASPALALFLVMAACSSDGNSQGQPCTKNDDCGGNLACQPIHGRNSNYCCPTPPETSPETVCHANP